MVPLNKYIDISQTNIASLEPDFSRRVKEWYDEMLTDWFPYIYYGYRSFELQENLYELYKSGKGGLAAPPGQSFHNYGLAIDWVNVVRSTEFPDKYDVQWENEEAYRAGTEAAKQFGLVAIEAESGHLQDGRFSTWKEAKIAFERGMWPTA